MYHPGLFLRGALSWKIIFVMGQIYFLFLMSKYVFIAKLSYDMFLT